MTTWRRLILRIILVLPPLAGGAELRAGHAVPAQDPAIVIEGRYAPAADHGILLGFTGTTFHLRFHGSDLGMLVRASSDEVYFDVSVDGAEPARLRCHAGDGTYPLWHSGAAGDHELTLTRRSESWQGTCEVRGFVLGDGAWLLPPPVLPSRKLMFIGDSITCGAATDIRPNDPLHGHTAHEDQTSDADYSFGKVLARRLHAQCHLVSYGGRGLIRDWQGLRTINNAPVFYGRALPDDPNLPWNPAAYVPDAIVVCLGTNDFNQGVPDEQEFVGAYVAFVRRLRRDAPRAQIFLADSPMLEDAPGKSPKRAVLHAYLLETIADLTDSHVHLAPIRHYAGVPHNGHPTRQDHEAIASELEPLLRRDLHWQ
jgi:hypothetical protein